MFSLKESGKIMGITALVSVPFLLIFTPVQVILDTGSLTINEVRF
tara:strand:- start:942 stop:1076 length:135 start_codon:yes stop_codon:yes gene_type:complete